MGKGKTSEELTQAVDQIKELQRKIDFDMSDFTVHYIVEQFHRDHFFVPDYQRKFIWPRRHRCRFIESVLLGLPIPMIFLAQTDDGRLEIVDGAQRIQTLEQFLNDDLRLSGLET